MNYKYQSLSFSQAISMIPSSLSAEDLLDHVTIILNVILEITVRFEVPSGEQNPL